MRSTRNKSTQPLMWAAGLAVLLVVAGAVALLLNDQGETTQAPAKPVVAAEPEASPAELPARPPEKPVEGITLQPLPAALNGNDSSQPLIVSHGPCGNITGRVLDQHGQPVAGTMIQVFQGNSLLPGPFPGTMQMLDLQTKSGADGAFTVSCVPAGNAYVLVGEHANFARSETPNLRVEAGQTLSGVTLTLIDGAVVRGTVTAVGGSPIAGARVEMHDTMAQFNQKPDELQPTAVEFTDTAGRYAFTHVSSRFFRVRASADTFETLTQQGSAGFDAQPTDMVLDFELNTGRSLPGRVIDTYMNPVKGARIEVSSMGKEPQSTSQAVSDASGAFVLEGIGNDDTYQLRATCKGYSDRTLPKIDLTGGEIQVTLEPRGFVEGTIVDGKGAPVERFTLHLMRSRQGADPNYINDHRDFNAPAGRFTLGDLDPGDYVVEARAENLADTRSEPFTVSRSAEASAQLKIVMTAGGTLTGVVLNADGKTVEGAFVALNPNNFVDSSIGKMFNLIAPTDERERHAQTSDDGRFVFEHVTPGVYQTHASHPDFAPFILNDVKILDDAAGTNALLKLTLPRGAVIAGQAMDDTGPMAFCKVQLNQKDSIYSDADTTDKDGKFRFRNLAQGEYQISVMPEKVAGEAVHPFLRLVYAKNSQKDIYVGEGQVLDGVLIRLQKQP